MALIVPRFTPGRLLFHELSAKARQFLLTQSVYIGPGKLETFPLRAPADHPWVTCLFVTDQLVPQMVVCETGRDMLSFQRVMCFDRLSPEWYFLKSWQQKPLGRKE